MRFSGLRHFKKLQPEATSAANFANEEEPSAVRRNHRRLAIGDDDRKSLF